MHSLRGEPLEQVCHGGHLPVRRRCHLQVCGSQRPGRGSPGGLVGRAASGWVCSGSGNPVFVCPVLCVLGEAPALYGHQQPSSLPCPRPARTLPSVSEAGRTILAIGFTVFTLRLLHVSVLHKQLGPRIIIVERTVSPQPWEDGCFSPHLPTRRGDEGRLLPPLPPEHGACGLRRDQPGAAAPPRRAPGVDLPPCALPAVPTDLRVDPTG